MAFIEVRGVTLNIPIVDANRSFRSALINHYTGGRISRSSRKNRIVVRALENVSFRLEQGDRLGLIGHNGSGKSTLLKILAGIYMPTAGSVAIEGSVTPLFNPGIGMDMDDTGYENITNIGLYLGMTPEEIEAKTDEIADFCELGDFLALPVRTYSAGMIVRLSFAVATALQPEILLLDEGIGAGDARFAERAQKRLDHFYEGLGIMVLATHGIGMIRQMCNKALLLEHGRMMAYGDVESVIEKYEERTQASASALVKLGTLFADDVPDTEYSVEASSACPNHPVAASAERNVLCAARLPLGLTTGKWYWEIHSPNIGLLDGALGRSLLVGVSPHRPGAGEAPGDIDSHPDITNFTQGWGWRADGVKAHAGRGAAWGGSTWSKDRVAIMIAVDLDAGKLWFGRDGRWFGSGNPAEGKDAAFDDIAGPIDPMALLAANGAGTAVMEFSVYGSSLAHQPPDGFAALDSNKAYYKRLKQAEVATRMRARAAQDSRPTSETLAYRTAVKPVGPAMPLAIESSQGPATLGMLPITLAKGKWYWEVHSANAGALHGAIAETAVIGASPSGIPESSDGGDRLLYENGWAWRADGLTVRDGRLGVWGSPARDGKSVFMIALDVDAGMIWFGQNGLWFEDGDPAEDFLPAFANISGSVSPSIAVIRDGRGSAVLQFQVYGKALAYAPPSGFEPLDFDGTYVKALRQADVEARRRVRAAAAGFSAGARLVYTTESRSIGPGTTMTAGLGDAPVKLGVLPIVLTEGKWYWEVHSPNAGAIGGAIAATAVVGVSSAQIFEASDIDEVPLYEDGWAWRADGATVHGGELAPYGSPTGAGKNVYMIALDMDAGSIWFGQNGKWFEESDPSEGSLPAFADVASRVSPSIAAVHSTRGTAVLQFKVHAADLTYSPPSGFRTIDSVDRFVRRLKDVEALLAWPAPSPTNALESEPQGRSVEVITVPPRVVFTNNSGFGTTRIGRLPVRLRQGKWYWELRSPNIDALDGAIAETAAIGVIAPLRPGAIPSRRASLTATLSYDVGFWRIPACNPNRRGARKPSAHARGKDNRTVYMVALDLDAGALWLGMDGRWLEQGDPALGLRPRIVDIDARPVSPAVQIVHAEAGAAVFEFLVNPADLRYAPPSGFMSPAIPSDAVFALEAPGVGGEVWVD